jgi:S1-C subfamily serine protease
MVVSLVTAISIYSLNEQVSTLRSEVAILQSAAETVASNQNGTIIATSNTQTTSLSALYQQVENSVVTIECTTYVTTPFGQRTAMTSEAQGSGFVYEYNGQMVIITNNHVIENAASITVTFADGNSYDAKVLGSDSANDLAVLSTEAPSSEYYPLEIASSSTLSVGDPVVAIGSPYGLTGTMTSGIVSALNRTLTITESTGSYDITGLIQTSAPINSGNSGGPLMTYDGKVIGITTAIVSNSDGLGFAISSNAILNALKTIL